MPGSLNVLHTGVGCKGKTQRQLVDHDLGREAHAQVGWTELADLDLIRDAAGPLVEAARELYRRRGPSLLLVTASTAVTFTGADLDAAVMQLREELPCPVVLIPEAAAARDLYAGYAAVVDALVGLVDWNHPASEPSSVSLVGHFFHRYEHEQAANLVELGRLLGALGARLGPTFLGGDSLDKLRQAHRCGVLARLPYAGRSAADLAALTGRRVVEAGLLPLGIRATGVWLRGLGEVLGLGGHGEAVTRLISREERKVSARLDLVRPKLVGRRIAIIGDTPTAAGWCLLAEELGLNPTLVVLVDRSLGGRPALRALLTRAGAGAALAESVPVIENPTLRELRALAGPPAQQRPFDVVVRPDLSLADTGWMDLPTVQTGFPSPHKHFIYPLPELGYTGAVALAQRLTDALGRVH